MDSSLDIPLTIEQQNEINAANLVGRNIIPNVLQSIPATALPWAVIELATSDSPVIENVANIGTGAGLSVGLATSIGVTKVLATTAAKSSNPVVKGVGALAYGGASAVETFGLPLIFAGIDYVEGKNIYETGLDDPEKAAQLQSESLDRLAGFYYWFCWN